ncbi:signal peptidase [Mycena floridula]|nr:signal peptidase [Mycena floridula]
MQNLFLKPPLSLLYWIPTVTVIGEYFYSVDVVNGRSMQPTLNPDSSPSRDVILSDKFSVHTMQNFRRGDIVSVRNPENARHRLIKRIIAMEGDSVRTLPPYPEPIVKVPQGHIWIEGDETFHSGDSNRFGPVPLALVESKLTTILWPAKRFGELYGHSRADWRHPRVIPGRKGYEWSKAD